MAKKPSLKAKENAMDKKSGDKNKSAAEKKLEKKLGKNA